MCHELYGACEQREVIGTAVRRPAVSAILPSAARTVSASVTMPTTSDVAQVRCGRVV